MKKRMELYMAVLLLVAVCLLSKEGAVLVSSMRAAEEKPCIVVDAGHGGDDPGKIGIHGELEKDINLAIAKKVKARLEKENITVILTRETDESLDKGESGSKKVADMRNRCRLIDEAKPATSFISASPAASPSASSPAPVCICCSAYCSDKMRCSFSARITPAPDAAGVSMALTLVHNEVVVVRIAAASHNFFTVLYFISVSLPM